MISSFYITMISSAGGNQLLSVISDDGRQFNLQIVRKDPSETQSVQQPIEVCMNISLISGVFLSPMWVGNL